MKSLHVLLLLLAVPVSAQEIGGKGTLYVGTYAKKILVIDEATMKTVDSIPISVGIPYNMSLSYNRTHIYAQDPLDEKVEVVDLATRKISNSFSLSKDSLRVQIVSMNVDPKERFAVILIRTTRRRPDRYEIGKPTLVKFDLVKKVVTDTIPWPNGQERENAQIIFSPSGDLMYFFTQDDILIYSSETLKQVDKWDLGRTWDEGLGRFAFGFPNDPFEEPGFYTGLFRTTDPVNRRSMMGIARVDLVKKSVDFYSLGPSDNVSMRLAPGRKRAYGLKSQTGFSEFWTFDLDSHRVLGRTEFKGRPRMTMTVSSNGQMLYIHTAGTTIDLYDTQNFKLNRTIDLKVDQTRVLLVPPAR